MSSATNRDRTSIGVQRSTFERLEDVRPWDSLSWDEFLTHLADVYEEHED